MDKAGGAVYADVLRDYGVDLQGLVTGDVSPRRALVLIEGLAPHTRASASLRDAENEYGWSTEAYLAAVTVDAVREGTFANMQVRTKKKLTPPTPIDIPGAKPKKKPAANRFVQMAQAQLAKSQRS